MSFDKNTQPKEDGFRFTPEQAFQLFKERIATQEEKAYQYLYDTYYATLCTFANSLVHDAFWAEAIVGDVFFNMWIKHDSLYIKSSLKGYLMQSVRNRCIDILRSEQSRKHFLKIALTHETEETIADDFRTHTPLVR